MLIPRSQASDAAADWAQKRKQALQRATELRAQRKAAEREASAAVRAPVRGLESDPLPKPPAGSAPDEAAAWWETNEGPAPVVEEVALKPPSAAEPVKAKAADKPRQRRQWGETVNVNNQSNQPNKERRGEHGDKKESSSRGNDSPPAEPGTPTGRLMPWEQELLIKRAEEEAHALGKEPPAPEVILARARGEDIPEPVAMSSNSPDPEVWGAPGRPAAAKPAGPAKKPKEKEVQAK
jgi:kinesin family protein 2/24